MKRLVLYTASAIAAAAIAATPAVAGLVGNSSFSQQIPVPTPSNAQQVKIVGNQLSVSSRGPAPQASKGTRSASATSTDSGHPEPGDDRGGAATRTPEPGDDRGGATTRTPEPGDDRGGAATRTPEPGDDRGGATTRTPEPGDDRGGIGGSDDGAGHH
ncbi:hypothetical protein ACSMXN_12690 [Jatrophihabitans sp. DSM 45814]